MKNKSAHHKEANTFKFLPFAERISNIDVGIFHRIGHEYETDTEETECFFYKSILKWDVMNLSEPYNLFRKEVKPETCITLPQLVLKKQHVIETLFKHTKLKNALSLQTLLDITIAVAKDLRKDFYEYFSNFFEIAVDLLQTKDTEQLEWTFTSLAHMYKLLWRPIIKDINNVFPMLVPLLSESKPEYINSFAAESFAFVARKVNDRKNFLNLILKSVKHEKDAISGCGKLFFEVTKGIDNKFHSSASAWITILLEALTESHHQNRLFQILEYFISNIVNHIHPKESEIFYSPFLSISNPLIEKLEDSHKNLNLLLLLIGQSIEHKNGKFLQNPSNISNLVMRVINSNNDELIKTTLQIILLLLLSKNVRLTQEQASSLIRKVLGLPKEHFLYFVENSFEATQFEPLILPSFLKLCASDLNETAFMVLTKLILKKSPNCFEGPKLPQWRKYSIDLEQSKTTLMNLIKQHLKYDNCKINQYICATFCIQHFKQVDKEIFLILENNLELFSNELESSPETKINFFLMNITIECLIHLNHQFNYGKCLDILLKSAGNEILALKTLSLLYETYEDLINMEELKKIHQSLEDNFTSPIHEFRLLTAFIYSKFDGLNDFKLSSSEDSQNQESWKVFSICYGIEEIEPSVQTYRDQVQLIEKLTSDKQQMLLCQQTEFKTVPLRYLCGALYINFQLLWEPIIKVLDSMSKSLHIEDFWKVFGREIKNVEGNIENFPLSHLVSLDSDEFLEGILNEAQSLDKKYDFKNYQLLLWKALTEFPHVAEAKTRDLSDYLLNQSKIGGVGCKTVNIKEKSFEEEQETEESSVKSKIGKNMKLLLHMLTVFSKFKSPKSAFKEQQLYKLYFDLLQHRNGEIQKTALNCILTYKNKNLTPYKDNLFNLIDDKNFKHEIVSFRVDIDSPTIQVEHREDLIPVVIQIVFSKMSAKIGGGKASGQHRRNLILRFLAGCQESELITFVQKAFHFCSEEMVYDLDKFLPPKRLQSALNLLNVIIEQFGGLMGENLLKYLLKVLLRLGGMIKIAFDNMSVVHQGFHNILKTLRASSVRLIERFFQQFENYPYSVEEIESVFDVFIWPYLSKLPIEGIHSPTSLMKLLITYGSNPKFFNLLVKYKNDDRENYPLPKIMELFSNPKSNISVINAIYEMLEKLLTLELDENENLIEATNILPVEESILKRIEIDDRINYGTSILLPFVSIILDKIKIKLQARGVNQKELLILSRISELVWQPDLCRQTLDLLLPVVLKKLNGSLQEETTNRFLNTVKNLLKLLEDTQSYLLTLAPLFGSVSYSTSRKLLLEIADSVLTKSEDQSISKLLNELNSFDSKWIDQPDFERRHKAFKEIEQVFEQGEVSIQLAIPLIYNFFYFIKFEKDLALKENASHLLKKLCPILLKSKRKAGEIDLILNKTLFELIRNGMRKEGDLRVECVKLLGVLARECEKSHVVLTDLNKLSCKQDLEVDFFENLVHLQLHRQGRALLKFCQIARNQTSTFNSRTLTQFILPLCSFYLCNDKFTGKNSIIDAAVEAVGVVCKMLPWHQYEGLLKYYLNQLRYKVDYQKQLVRLTVTVLDSFRFDLSKGHYTPIEPQKEENTEPSKQNEDVPQKPEKDVEASNSEELEQENKEEDDDLDKFLKPEDETEEGIEEDQIKVVDKTIILSKSSATRVIKSIQFGLLPQLKKCLAEMTQSEGAHKLNKKRLVSDKEEEDLLRVPISLAVVKLLQKLPEEILETNLPGVFMKLCTFLKSQLESVRKVTRETLQKIMIGLGPKRLGLLLNEMTPLLTRGFHSHVLVYTVHGVLSSLKDQYKAQDLDTVLLTVLNLCTADLFGTLSEEKEIAKIAVKHIEAKSTKSFDTLQILAQYITESCLMDLILPIKQILLTSTSFKTVNKAQESLRYIVMGLIENSFVPVESLLKFAFGTASQSIPQLLPQQKQEKEQNIPKIIKEDCYIIPKAPGRAGFKHPNTKSSSDANAHVLIEFGLRLCLTLLKRGKADVDLKPYLNPFVAVFSKCLKSKHIKLSTLSMQCLSWALKLELPSLKDSIKSVVKNIFAILHKYGSAGLSKGDNFELVQSAFKTMSVIVRDVSFHTIDTHQLKALLVYVEQDMHDHDRQATAFNLLKAILTRKLVVPELNDVIFKVEELSITSELDHVRAQARSVVHQYLMEYPLGNTLEKHLDFYTSQLSYDLQFGRESALEMISTLINSFPMKILEKSSGPFFITLGARLVNDEVPEVRKSIADVLITLISKLSKSSRNSLFDIVLLWFKEKNISHRRLAAQLCGIFVTVEKTEFENKFSKLNPLILKQFGLDDQAGRFVKLDKPKESKDSEEDRRVKDHHLFQVLQLLLKLCRNCPKFLKQEGFIADLAVNAQNLLGYEHDWVRLAATQFIGFVLANIDIEDLKKCLAEDCSKEGYLFADPENSIKSLTLDLCDQLTPQTKPDLAEQVVKNLVFIARVLGCEETKKINLVWLVKRIRKIVNSEIVENPDVSMLRQEVFKWIAGIVTALEADKVRSIAEHILAPLVREMLTTEEKNAEVRQLAKEVAGLIKSKLGMEFYSETLSKLQQRLSVKRAERKRSRTQLAVTDPEVYAKKKIKRHERKKVAKKRKIEQFKGGKKTFKKRKVVDIELDSSEVM